MLGAIFHALQTFRQILDEIQEMNFEVCFSTNCFGWIISLSQKCSLRLKTCNRAKTKKSLKYFASIIMQERKIPPLSSDQIEDPVWIAVWNRLLQIFWDLSPSFLLLSFHPFCVLVFLSWSNSLFSGCKRFRAKSTSLASLMRHPHHNSLPSKLCSSWCWWKDWETSFWGATKPNQTTTFPKMNEISPDWIEKVMVLSGTPCSSRHEKSFCHNLPSKLY